MLNSKVLIGTFVISLLVTFCVPEANVRALDAIPADSVSRFPHHVVINTRQDNNGHLCSGSILTDQWILTSLKCIGKSTDFVVEFKRLHLQSEKFVFSIGLSNPEVHRYPTEFDDLVLVKLPVKLIFDEELNSINIANKSDIEIAKKFATMPGFNKNNGSDYLTSNMYQIADPSECTAVFGDKYDKFFQICGREWMHYKSNACGSELGAGLLINWPQKSELVGIFSAPEECNSANSKVAVYTNVAKYMKWIEEIIGEIKTETEPPITAKKSKPVKNWRFRT